MTSLSTSCTLPAHSFDFRVPVLTHPLLQRHLGWNLKNAGSGYYQTVQNSQIALPSSRLSAFPSGSSTVPALRVPPFSPRSSKRTISSFLDFPVSFHFPRLFLVKKKCFSSGLVFRNVFFTEGCNSNWKFLCFDILCNASIKYFPRDLRPCLGGRAGLVGSSNAGGQHVTPLGRRIRICPYHSAVRVGRLEHYK